LRQVLINLLGNAIKFTDTGFVLIKVKLSSLTSDTVCLYFEVEDTGIGISPKDQKNYSKDFPKFMKPLPAFMGVQVWVWQFASS